MEAFDSLPIAAIVNAKFFVVHAGISPHITRTKDINNINWFIETPL